MSSLCAHLLLNDIQYIFPSTGDSSKYSFLSSFSLDDCRLQLCASYEVICECNTLTCTQAPLNRSHCTDEVYKVWFHRNHQSLRTTTLQNNGFCSRLYGAETYFCSILWYTPFTTNTYYFFLSQPSGSFSPFCLYSFFISR